MATSGRGVRLPVAVDDTVWREEVQRYDSRSTERIAAERERRTLDAGLEIRALMPCSAEGRDGTNLAVLVKVYVPISDGPASERPLAFVLRPLRGDSGPYLELLAYGERHPDLVETQSVYARAHKRLHGRYPGQ